MATPESPKTIFARRLREVRRSIGLTQAELADLMTERLGVTIDSSAITRIEQQDRVVRIEEAAYAAEILGVPLTALVTDQDPVEARLMELRQALEREETRQREAEYEHQQAVAAQIDIERQIEHLEGSAGH